MLATIEITKILEGVVLSTTFIIFFTYLILAITSARELRDYFKRNSFSRHESLHNYPEQPSVTIIAPAYNEGKSIVDIIKALLQLNYNNYEIIVVNDGSKDDTVERVLSSFALYKATLFIDYQIPCQKIKGVYRSNASECRRLIFIDKANGGKADALNAGLNLCTSQLIVTIDADSIIDPDALLKMAKPFMTERNRKVIATGGVVRIVNSCIVSGGKVTDVNLPNNLLAAIQVLEYTRSFLMARMAWSRINGLMLISGALGMFDREIMIAAGGYSTKTVGEDMEVVVRMRRYMMEKKQKSVVFYIPDPLCWTEVPTSTKVLQKQRNRWMRGLMETLISHKKIALNPKYGVFGFLGYPYWLLLEWAAPLIEFFGILYFIALILLGAINWSFFFFMLFFVYSFAITMSILSILFEEMTYHKYKKKNDLIRLLLIALIEPIIYHPMVTLWSVKANLDFMIGRKGWGKMERKGFKKR